MRVFVVALAFVLSRLSSCASTHTTMPPSDMNISYGLVDPADIFLSESNGGILGPHGVS